MIIDSIDNIKLKMFTGIMKEAFTLLKTIDFVSKTVGKYQVDNDNLLYHVQEYETLDVLSVEAEFHKKYCDIQYIVMGEERIGWAPPNKELMNSVVYDKDNDIAFFKAPNNEMLFDLKPTQFIFFAPFEIHRPRLEFVENKKNLVKKVVIKINAEKIE